MNDGKPERAFFRVEYPFNARPFLGLGEESYEILDLSEQGLRFSLEGKKPPDLLSTVKAVIRFVDTEWAVEGTPIRSTVREVCLLLKKGIPWRRILEEQRRLIRSGRI